MKELIVGCLMMITNNRFNNLKSGWKTILSIVGISLEEHKLHN